MQPGVTLRYFVRRQPRGEDRRHDGSGHYPGLFHSDGANPQGYSAVEQIRFGDGTTWDIATVKAMVIVPTAGDDVLTGSPPMTP